MLTKRMFEKYFLSMQSKDLNNSYFFYLKFEELNKTHRIVAPK